MKKLLENIIVTSRWIYAPIYIGLLIVIFLFAIIVLKEISLLLYEIFNLRKDRLIIEALELCDAILIANLLFIVVISGYENFISTLSLDSNKKKVPAWLTEISHGDVKMKIATSLVSISSIQLLKQFIEVKSLTNRELSWYVAIHITFVFSAWLCCYIIEKPKQK